MEIFRGKPVAGRIDSEIRRISERLPPPTLAVYLVGGERSSRIYARSKARKGENLGARVLLREFPASVSSGELENALSRDASDPRINGIIIERPLPGDLDIHRLMSRVPPVKDVEGLTPENYGLMGLGKPRFIPPTPLGALFLLMYYDIAVEGKEVVVIGRSPNVGKPLAELLSQKAPWGNATVTILHSRTADMISHTGSADIVITAAGRARMLKGRMIAKGALLVDLGMNQDGKGIVGDVDMESVDGVARGATPTPGGTGPVTVSSIFLNLYRAMMLQEGSDSGFTDEMIGTICR